MEYTDKTALVSLEQQNLPADSNSALSDATLNCGDIDHDTVKDNDGDRLQVNSNETQVCCGGRQKMTREGQRTENSSLDNVEVLTSVR